MEPVILFAFFYNQEAPYGALFWIARLSEVRLYAVPIITQYSALDVRCFECRTTNFEFRISNEPVSAGGRECSLVHPMNKAETEI